MICYHQIDNIFSDQQRKKLVKDSLPHCVGRQKTSDLRFDEDFKSPSQYIIKLFENKLKVKLEILNLWISYSRGRGGHFHTHPYDFACIYYMKTNPFLNSGTMFKGSNNKKDLVRVPQNSSILFDPSMPHAIPSFFLPFRRYALVMDVSVVKEHRSLEEAENNFRYNNFIRDKIGEF